MKPNSGLCNLFESIFRLPKPSRRVAKKRQSNSHASLQAEVFEERVLLTVPGLNSNPGATFDIYLDFDGDTAVAPFFVSSNALVRGGILPQEFTLDSNVGVANSPVNSPLENQWQQEIFDRVAEDFRPFTVNVTTDLPTGGNQFVHVYIGRSGAVPRVLGGTVNLGNGTGVFAVTGEVDNNRGMPVLVFPDDLQAGAKTPSAIARLVSKGVGIQLGLAPYVGTSANGNSAVSPIMGNLSTDSERDIWSTGAVNGGVQNDIDVITGNGLYTNAGVRLRGDDFGDTINSASLGNSLQPGTTPISVAQGAIQVAATTNTVDKDFFKVSVDLTRVKTLTALHFITEGLNVTNSPLPNGLANPNPTPGSNLDVVTNLYDSEGTLVASDTDPTSIFGNIIYAVPTSEWGTIANYYLEVTTTSERGSLGEYNVSGYFESVQSAVLTQPTGTIAVQFPLFTWTSPSNPIAYELQV